MKLETCSWKEKFLHSHLHIFCLVVLTEELFFAHCEKRQSDQWDIDPEVIYGPFEN